MNARARATQWLIAALNSIEPFIMNVALIDLFYADQEWAKLRRPSAVEFARRRLDALAKALGDKPYLDGATFTAGDLMMTTVIRIMPELASDPRLTAYVALCTSRPTFKRAPSRHRSATSERRRENPTASGYAAPPRRHAAWVHRVLGERLSRLLQDLPDVSSRQAERADRDRS